MSREGGSRLKKIGSGLLVPIVFVVGLLLITLFLRGMVWVSERVLPWLITAGQVVFDICLLLLLPLAFFRKTRPWAGMGLYISSFLFGAFLLAFSCIVVVEIWGYGALAVGLLFAGVGVVPVAILATLFHAEWSVLLNLVIGIVLTFGTRGVGAYLATRAERKEEETLVADEPWN